MSPPAAANPPAPQRILVRGVNWLGDAVMTTPALQRLREAVPSARITLLTHAKLAPLWQRHSAIDDVITFTDRDNILGLARRLRTGHFDTALVLPNSPRSALEVFLAGIPRRIGLAVPLRRWLINEPVAPPPGLRRMRKRSPAEIRQLTGTISAGPPRVDENFYRPQDHQVHHYLHLAAALGASTEPVAPRLEVSDAEVSAVQQRFGFSPAPEVPLFGLNPGAEYGPAKRWPRENFIAAAIEIQRRSGCHWWIFGGPADESVAGEIARAIAEARSGPPESVRSLAGQTNLRELCAALKACRFVLTNDTGPMHVAAAVGTRVIVPFGSTSAALTGPGLPTNTRHRFINASVPCAPCFLRECPIDFRCMKGITVEAIVEAAFQIVRDHQ